MQYGSWLDQSCAVIHSWHSCALNCEHQRKSQCFQAFFHKPVFRSYCKTHFRWFVFREPLQHVFSPKSLIVHTSPPPCSCYLWPCPGGFPYQLKSCFISYHNTSETSMDQSLKPNASVLKCYFSDKSHQHTIALCSHTESSGGRVCVQSAGACGLLGERGSAAGWGHSGSVC